MFEDGFFTENYKIISVAPVLQWFVDWLTVLSNCKLRIVRSAVIEVASRLIIRCAKFHEDKESSAKRAMKKFMQGIS